jgi:hypothetical protein
VVVRSKAVVVDDVLLLRWCLLLCVFAVQTKFAIACCIREGKKKCFVNRGIIVRPDAMIGVRTPAPSLMYVSLL